MTSLVKKVLRNSDKKKQKLQHQHSFNVDRRTSAPKSPPSPELTDLNPEEIAILQDVFKRQTEFESEIVKKQHKLRECLMAYEEEVRKHASQKMKITQVDLRMCRLCYRTESADDIGTSCTICHKRVCNKCGSLSKPSWNSKKNKTIKPKWRCNICQLKRDIVAMTGIWYHGNVGLPPEQALKFQKKFSISELDSSENDAVVFKLGKEQTDDEESEEMYESDGLSFKNHQHYAPLPRNVRRSSVRQRIASFNELDDDDVEEEIDDEQFRREREICRMKRRQRLRSGGSLSDKPKDDCTTDQQPLFDSCASDMQRDFSSFTDNYLSSDMDSERMSEIDIDRTQGKCNLVHNQHNEEVLNSIQSVRNGSDSNKRSGVKISKSGSCKERFQRECQYFKKDSRNKFCRQRSCSVEPCQRNQCSSLVQQKSEEFSKDVTATKSVPFSNSSTDVKMKNKSDFACAPNVTLDQSDFDQHYSRDSRLSTKWSKYNDSINSSNSGSARDFQHSRDSCSSFDSMDLSPVICSTTRTRRKLQKQHEAVYASSTNIFAYNALFDTSGNLSNIPPSSSDTFQSDMERKYTAHKTSQLNELTILHQTSNSLSPDMALKRTRHRRNRKQHNRSESISPKVFSDHDTGTPCDDDVTEVRRSRRMTLSHCENINTVKNQLRDGLNSSCPREIILHRNKKDCSIRTQGLGMHVVGGLSGPGGSLCAYVSMVTLGSQADNQGISKGDQVVQWNWKSLNNLTFEEAQEIMQQSGHMVQLSVIHHVFDRSSSLSVGGRSPIIIKSDSVVCTDIEHPGQLNSSTPRRRMLPKTPIEIKRDVKHISGRIWMKLDFDANCNCLIVVLLRGEEILLDSNGGNREPNALTLLHLLPKRSANEAKESNVKFSTQNPHWNETFVFADTSSSKIKEHALEVTIWHYTETEDEFLGEVLIDLDEAMIDNSVYCYQLEDHDENSSPLPYRKKSFSHSDSAVSPATSIDTSSIYPSQDPSPRSSLSTKANENPKEKENRSSGRDKVDLSSSTHSSPLYSPTSAEFKIGNSLPSLIRRKIGVIARISSVLSIVHDTDLPTTPLSVRSHSFTDVRHAQIDKPSFTQLLRRSFKGRKKGHIDLLALPHKLLSSSLSGDFFDDKDSDALKSPTTDRLAPEDDDFTLQLGAGQIAPKSSFESSACGTIKMGFMVSKGQLEIDILVVKGLQKSGLHTPPDTYVKTYLVEGAKTIQKKKTQTIRMCFDPVFRKTIKYSACNIHGRFIKVNVWGKQKAFDRKQGLGEALVKLDSLDLSQHRVGWYQLFPNGAAEIGSQESLNYWLFH